MKKQVIIKIIGFKSATMQFVYYCLFIIIFTIHTKHKNLKKRIRQGSPRKPIRFMNRTFFKIIIPNNNYNADIGNSPVSD